LTIISNTTMTKVTCKWFLSYYIYYWKISIII